MPERSEESYSNWGTSELREKRAEMGLTKRALAKKLGVSERQYAYYESGHTKVDKPLEYAVRWLSVDPMVKQDTVGTLTGFEKERISRLLKALQNHPTDDLDEKTEKILRQASEEIALLLSKLSN